jgi:hypothetical protein
MTLGEDTNSGQEDDDMNGVESLSGVQQLALLRAIVAALGERATPPWWRTQFLTEVGLRTVARIVPRTAVPAAVTSTSNAARIEHDRWIGIGRRFHLFRLPSQTEHAVEIAFRETGIQSRIKEAVQGRESLLEALAVLAGSLTQSPMEGPVALGDMRQIGKPAANAGLGAHYLAAFTADVRSFPYFEQTTA